MRWDIEQIKTRRYREKIPTIRIAPDQSIRKYKSLNLAAFINGTYPEKIKEAIEKGEEINGYKFDYL